MTPFGANSSLPPAPCLYTDFIVKNNNEPSSVLRLSFACCCCHLRLTVELHRQARSKFLTRLTGGVFPVKLAPLFLTPPPLAPDRLLHRRRHDPHRRHEGGAAVRRLLHPADPQAGGPQPVAARAKGVTRRNYWLPPLSTDGGKVARLWRGGTVCRTAHVGG